MMRDRSLYMGQERHDMATVVQQRDDAIARADRLARTLAPVLAWWAKERRVEENVDERVLAHDALDQYLDDYGTEVEA